MSYFVSKAMCLGAGLFFVLYTAPVYGLADKICETPLYTVKVSKSRVLKPSQAKKIAKTLVETIYKSHFAKNLELPLVISLGGFEVIPENSRVTTEFFTDQILNALLEQSGLLVANQEGQMGESMRYHLQRYDDEATLLSRAKLLGAGGVLIGRLATQEKTNAKGKRETYYTVDFRLKDTFAENLLIDQKLDFNHNGRLLKEKKHARR